MPGNEYIRILTVGILFVLAIALGATTPGVSAAGEDDAESDSTKSGLAHPNLSIHLNHLVEGYDSGEMSQQQAAEEAPVSSGGSVAVTIYLDGHVSDLVEFLEDNGGDPRNVGSDYIEAYVPVDLLARLSQQPGVTRVWEIIPPQPTYGNVTSQAVVLHQADSWQNAGFRGQGVKVGVIDVGFTGYSSLMGVELPDTVVARCYTGVGRYTSNLADCETSDPLPDFRQCSRGNSGSVHGTAVAEAVIDIAPDAILYISQPGSWGDLQATAKWMAGEGVQIINYSAGWTHYGSRGDGTSPYSNSPLNTVDQAVDDGIIWVNAAGNSGEDAWFGSFSDPDGNGEINFNNSGDEINLLDLRECRRYTIQLRWEDSWGGAATDLDMYLWDKRTGDVLSIPRAWGSTESDYEQSGASHHEPFEYISFRSPISTRDVGVKIVHFSGPAPDWVQLELFSGPGGLNHFSGSGGIANPAESANPGLLAVGAAPFFDTNSVEYFSSRGPAPDGRIKPEIVGVDCAASVSYEEFDFRGNTCWFPGTSQASPHVAGMAALVLQQFPSLSPEQVAAYLKDNAQPRGTVPNNTWGHGFAQLPAREVGECVHELTANGTTSGQWSERCHSHAAERGYSQYYTFTLDEDAHVTIDLISSVDPYLFLREGESRFEDLLYENDDIVSVENPNSRIVAMLAAGTYTIEATTYEAGVTGSFDLTISGIGGDGALPGTSDMCGETVTGDVTISGTWAAGCQSPVTDRGYTRYYTFTLAQQSQVTIELTSSIDTYLYLREGNARTGAFLYENDDIVSGGVNRNSRIGESLSAGTYTIEATTYSVRQSGNFSLSFSGLTGESPEGPGTELQPAPGDGCGETVAGDETITGAWVADCQSLVAERGYARFYTFSLTQQSQVTMELTSSIDTYLYLREGNAKAGAFLYENDDIAIGGVNLNSRISETLGVGTYTIEATTYDPGQTGAFTLTIGGLAGESPEQPGTEPEPGENCVESITTDDTIMGTWASDCQSTAADRGYARYYGFTLLQQSYVTIELTSSIDPYLYLRDGDARSGVFLYENDDIAIGGVNLNSRINETLPAGTYTIEATTYNPGETGNFTLTIALGSNEGAAQVENETNEPNDAEVDLSSANGQPGSIVTVYGENFAPFVRLENVRVGSEQVTFTPATKTDSDGRLSFEVKIPNSKLGTQPIEVTVGKTVATVAFTVTGLEVGPGEVVELGRGLESLEGNLVSVWHFNNNSKVWTFYSQTLAEENSLAELITGQVYLLQVKSDIQMTLNKETRSLTCVGANCWNQIVW